MFNVDVSGGAGAYRIALGNTNATVAVTNIVAVRRFKAPKVQF